MPFSDRAKQQVHKRSHLKLDCTIYPHGDADSDLLHFQAFMPTPVISRRETVR